MLTVTVGAEGGRDALLEQARACAAAYAQDFVNLLSEERSVQELREPLSVDTVAATPRALPGAPAVAEQFPTTEERTRRRLRANYIVIRADTGLGWVPFRDVIEVDGRPVHDRPERLVELLAGTGPADLARARQIVDEGTRHDLGDLSRTMNMPLLGLLFLHPDHMASTGFLRDGEERVGRRRAVVYAFHEVEGGGLVTGPAGERVTSHGRIWIAGDTGAVLKTEHLVETGGVQATVTVTYRDEPRLGRLVPDRMEEVYRWTRSSRTLTVTARYEGFRRLDVRTHEKPQESQPERSGTAACSPASQYGGESENPRGARP
jgi:hypothetical protein